MVGATAQNLKNRKIKDKLSGDAKFHEAVNSK